MPKFELHRNHKLFLGFSALILVGSGVGTYYTYQECKRLDEESANLQVQIDTARGKINKIEVLEREVIILRENLEDYVRILPSASEVNEFYRTLNGFSNDSGILITELNPQPTRAKKKGSDVFDSAMYKLKFEATFGQSLQFLNSLENHERFVSVAEIKVKAGDVKNENKADPTHNFDLTVITFVYAGEDVGPGPTVQISGYERKRAQLYEQIAEARHDLALERFQLLTNTVRRDPMVDPRVRTTSEVVAGVDIEQQRAFLDTTFAKLEECDALFGLMNRAGSVMREMELKVEALNLLTEIQASVDDAVARGLISDPTLKREFDRRLLPELSRLRKAAGPEELRKPDQDRIRIEQALAQMERAILQDDYESCIKAYEIVSNLGAANSTDPALAELQNRMETLYLTASIAVEFRNRNLRVSGLVHNPDKESVAIIDNVVYRIGEALDNDLFLNEIHEDHLVFEFKGVSLIYDL